MTTLLSGSLDRPRDGGETEAGEETRGEPLPGAESRSGLASDGVRGQPDWRTERSD